MTEKRKPGRPRTVTQRRWAPWESPDITAQLDGILAALEVPAIDAESRGVFQRTLYRQKYFGGDAKGQIIFTIRCITESAGNENALIGKIVSAVSSCVTPEVMSRGLQLIEAFDSIPLVSTLETMRSLSIFSESSLAHYLSIAIRNKLAAILLPAARQEPAVKVKQARKPPRAETRVPEVTRNIALGNELVALRSTIKSNLAFGRQVRRRFEVDAQASSELMRVARAFGNKPAVYTRLSWHCLVLLAGRTMPMSVRDGLEARIIAGEKIVASDIEAARKAHAGRQAVSRPCRKVGINPSRQAERPREKLAA